MIGNECKVGTDERHDEKECCPVDRAVVRPDEWILLNDENEAIHKR
ncbi:MAG: hypothetical protein J07HN4v3_02304 [Halonotius sp. J07HN4]|nr:MAG: hypothetical protein J07HN4v3_02304 [Halonotius sp. J07HN4]